MGGRKGFRLWVAYLLLLMGAGLLGFGAWQYFGADEVDGASKTAAAKQYGSVSQAKHFVPVAKVHKLGQVFGRMRIPRLGSDWVRLIGEGTKWHPVLNEIGIGHYIGTAMPGQVGNFATAAHRGGFGGSYKNIHRLVKGDLAYVETDDGVYTYEYMQTKIVLPSDSNVISAVPRELIGAHAGGRYMTLTSCEPIYVNTHRIIVWLELKAFAPNR